MAQVIDININLIDIMAIETIDADIDMGISDMAIVQRDMVIVTVLTNDLIDEVMLIDNQYN